MNDLKELRRLATQVLTIEKGGNYWKNGVPDNEEQLAKQHEVELTQAQIELRNALRNPADVIELLDRLEAAEKVCYSLFTDFCEWQVDIDALKEWQDKYEKQYESEQEVSQCADQQQKKS